MDTFYVVVHRNAGPVASCLTLSDAGRKMLRLLTDEPDWSGDLSIEVFTLVVAPTVGA